MKRATLTVLLLSIGAVLPLALSRAQDEEPKKKRKKERDDHPLEDAEARRILARVASGERGAGRAVDELLSKHANGLVPAREGTDEKDNVPLVPVRAALWRALGRSGESGVAALAKEVGDSAATALAAAQAGDAIEPLLAVADRAFPLEAGAKALLLAAERCEARGSLVGAVFALRALVEAHPDAAVRGKAGAGLVRLAPLLDAGEAEEIAVALARDEATRATAKALRDAVATSEEPRVPPAAVTGAGGLAPLASGPLPAASSWHLRLADVPAGLDWRTATPKKNEYGHTTPVLRRLLTGHASAGDLLLVHLGKSIVAMQDGAEVWSAAGRKGLEAWLDSLKTSLALPRFGIAVVGTRAYATVRGIPPEDAGKLPHGRLVAIDLENGKLLWEASLPEEAGKKPGEGKKPKKADEKKADEKKADEKKADEKKPGAKPEKRPEKKSDGDAEGELSFVGTPLAAGGLVFCGAARAGSPEETFAAAVDAATGVLVWRRALTSSSPFATESEPWDPQLPRATPAASLGLVAGALLVCSNNGCVAALDTGTGRPFWVRSYEHDEPWNRENGGEPGPAELARTLGRGYDPVLDVGGTLALVLPSDGPQLSIVRATDGVELLKRGRGAHAQLLGAARGRIVLAGEKGLGAYRLKRELVGFAVKDGAKESLVEWKDGKKEAGDLILGRTQVFSVGPRNAYGLGE